MFGKFQTYAPHFERPLTVEESVNACIDVVDNATIERDGGQMVSHLGSKRWL